MKNQLILRANLKKEDAKRFLQIKEAVGIQHNAELVRFLIKQFAIEEPAKSRTKGAAS